MRVNDRNLLDAAGAAAGRTAETQKVDRTEGALTGGATSGGDRVELSSTLGRLSEAISAQNQERAARVTSLTMDYQNGRYRADDQATGRAIVSEALAAGHD